MEQESDEHHSPCTPSKPANTTATESPSSEHDPCPVCLMPFEDLEESFVTPCNHRYTTNQPAPPGSLLLGSTSNAYRTAALPF